MAPVAPAVCLELKSEPGESTSPVVAPLKEMPAAPAAPAAPTSRADANLVSQTFLLWVFPLIRQGSDKSAEITDASLPELPPGWSARSFRERAAEAHQQTVSGNAGRASLCAVCWRLLRCELGAGLILSLFHGCVVTVARPLLLKSIISAVEDDEIDRAYWLAGVLAGVLLLEGILAASMKHILGERLGTQFSLIAGSLLQAKAVRLESRSDGKQASMISTDIIQVFEMIKFMGWVPSALVSFAGGTVIVILTVGVEAGLIGMSVVIAVIIASYLLALRNRVLRKTQLAKIDARSSMVTHVVEGIKAIKLNVWEPDYTDIIRKLRAEELATGETMLLNQFIGVQLGRGAPSLAACVTFIYIGVIKDEQLKAADVFATLTVFLSLRIAIIMIPMSLTMFGYIQTSFDRLTDFLNLPERTVQDQPDQPGQMVEIHEADFSYETADEPNPAESEQTEPEARPAALSGINLSIPKGSLTAVIGAVGSGKSTLLGAMLSEVRLAKGSCRVNNSSVGYTAQSAFVIHGTVRENVIMQHEYDPVRFNTVAEATCLAEDIAGMVDGLNTEIGERGVTLSGGQQARLAIARALYPNPAMLLLDDALAAVDNKVANHILQHAIIKYAKAGGTCVMAMNQLHLLSNFDRIVLLKDGRIVEEGTYDRLMEAKGSFQVLLDELNIGALKMDPADEAKPGVHARDEEASVQLVEKEKVQKGEWVRPASGLSAGAGDVNIEVLMKYAKAASYCLIIMAICICLIAYGCMLFADRWLAIWVNKEEDSADVNTAFYGAIYAAANVGFAVFGVFSAVVWILGGIRAGTTMHSDIISTLLHAPLRFFEANPSGRILSRVITDMVSRTGRLMLTGCGQAQVDQYLIGFTDALCTFVIMTFILCLQICIILPLGAAIIGLALILFGFVLVFTERTNRQIKRIANNRTSQVLGSFGESVKGRATICAMGMQGFFADRYAIQLEKFCQGIFVAASVGNWSMLFSYMLAFIITVPSCYLLLYQHNDIETSMVGLALTYLLTLPFFIQQSAFLINMWLGYLTSLERLLQYRDSALVPQEPSWHLEGEDDHAPWPPRGEITFESVTLRYQPSLPPALNSLNLVFKGGSKTGVVGRTGAGKSSLMACLFRLNDFDGCVKIDGTNICELGLHTLRNTMRIIPQHPLLMSGTVRNNLDPFEQRVDGELVKVLEKVGLSASLLDAEVGQGASLLSSGERQLLTFARVLLSDAKIVAMDEPTSSIDSKTDGFVQSVVREQFGNKTVITIAHRIQSIIDYDAVAVMGKGKLLELGPPAELLKDPNSNFSGMLDSLGGETADKLRESAVESAAAERNPIFDIDSVVES